MNAGRLLPALMTVLALTIAPLAPPARAQVADDVTTAIGDETTAGPTDEIERWWGAVGAVVCAAEIRIIRVAPAIGMNPYLIAAGLAGCLLAALDVMTTQ